MFFILSALITVGKQGARASEWCPLYNEGSSNQDISIPTTVINDGCPKATSPGINAIHSYTFVAEAGKKLKFTLSPGNPFSDVPVPLPQLSLYYGGSNIAYAYSSSTQPAIITHYIDVAGSYAVHIGSWGNQMVPISSPITPYTLAIEVAPNYTVECNQPCQHNEDCITRYCHTPNPSNPEEKFCRSSGSGCAGNLDCSCNQPVNGGWCDYGACSATICGDLGTRTRTCACPTPQNGGASCSGSAVQQCRGCNCTPVNGEWRFECGDCSGGGCSSEGQPIAGTMSCTAVSDSCTASCNGSCGSTTKTVTCYPDCPYPYPTPTSEHDYRSYCGDGWYKGDPNPLAIICTIVRLLNVFILSVGAIFVMFVFISAIKFALAQGDPKAMQGAKQTLTMAIIGMLVVIGVFTILTIMRNIFGLKYQLTMNPFDVLSDNLAKLLERFNIYW